MRTRVTSNPNKMMSTDMSILPLQRQSAEALDPIDFASEISTPRLYEVNPNPTDEMEMTDEQDLIKQTYGKFFQDKQQFEHFAMLPIRAEDRMEFIKLCHKQQEVAKKDKTEDEDNRTQLL